MMARWYWAEKGREHFSRSFGETLNENWPPERRRAQAERMRQVAIQWNNSMTPEERSRNSRRGIEPKHKWNREHPLELARNYAREAARHEREPFGRGAVLETETPEPGSLIPDEDTVFGLLGLEGMTDSDVTDLEAAVYEAYFDSATEEAKSLGIDPPRNVQEAMDGLNVHMEDLSSHLVSPADEMKHFAEWIARKRPKLAERIIRETYAKSVAHVGPIRVKGRVV